MKIGFLYGTETGNSEMLCEDIEEDIGSSFECEIQNMGEVVPSELDPEVFYMIVTSTHGNGDLPAQAAPFADALEEEKPDLSHIRFAIFGLGDMVFEETFAHGSKRVMELMLACGAVMVGERG
ncbi:MAG: flavodoxin domain-containing protein, partial [Pseudomonadota bacterium]